MSITDQIMQSDDVCELTKKTLALREEFKGMSSGLLILALEKVLNDAGVNLEDDTMASFTVFELKRRLEKK